MSMLNYFRLLVGILEREKRDLLEARRPAHEITAVEDKLVFVRRTMEIARHYLDLRGHPRRGVLQPTSATAHARTVLLEAGHPLHVDDIIAAIDRTFGKAVKKASLTSTLSKMARAGEIFTLLQPGTYGLMDWSKAGLGAIGNDRGDADLPGYMTYARDNPRAF